MYCSRSGKETGKYGRGIKGETNMGIFEFLFQKHGNNETGANKTEKEQPLDIKEEMNLADTLKEVQEEKFTFMVEQVFTDKEQKTLATGVVRGGKATVNSKVYIITRGRRAAACEIEKIENPKEGILEEAEKDMPVALYLKGVTPQMLHMADIITNEEPNLVDLSKPIYNGRIKGLMRQASLAPSDELMNLIYEEFAMNTRMIGVILLSEEPEADENGMAKFKEGTTMQLPLLTAPNGSKFYPVFTDMQECEKWHEILEPKTMLVNFDEIYSIIKGNPDTNGVVINPFGENMMVDEKLLDHLKERKQNLNQQVVKEHISADTKISVADLAEFPVEMAKAMTQVLEKEPEVKKAWLRLMKKQEEVSYLFVVDMDGTGLEKSLFDKVAQAAQPYLKGVSINMITCREDLGKQAVEGVPAFYQVDSSVN